jgi:hypothetical protein
MKVARIVIALVTVFAFSAGAGLAVAQPPDKVTVCHNIQDTGETVDDNGAERKVYEGTTIDVSERSLEAHLNHGDLLGPCTNPADGGTKTIDGEVFGVYNLEGPSGSTWELIAERPYN